MRYFLNRFSAITCREDDGVQYANDVLELKNKVKWVIDPVFLCNKKNFDKIVSSVKAYEGDYIGLYMLKSKERMRKLLFKVKEHFSQYNVRCIDGGGAKDLLSIDDCEYITPFPIENSLELIAHCNFFVTDSFHGVCFAIIFKRDFLVIPRDFKDRFVSLLSRLGLLDRILENNLSNFKENLFSPINWDEVYSRLSWFCQESREWLKTKLEEEVRLDLQDIDIAMETISNQQIVIEQLTKRIDELENKIL